MMIAASSLFGMTTIIAKILGQGFEGESLHPFQVSSGRFFFALMTLIIFYSFNRFQIKSSNLRIHFGRSILGWLGVSSMFAAVMFIPISDAIAISFMNPVIAMFVAIPVLKEKVGRTRWLAASISFAGALILLRPGLDTFHWAAALAFGAALFLGIEVILIKKLSSLESPIQILIINNSIGTVLSLTAASFFWIAPTPRQWIELAALGVIMVSGQFLFIQSMKSGDASYALPFSYMTLVFGATYDFFIFSTQPDWISYVGAATIVSGAILLGTREVLKKNR